MQICACTTCIHNIYLLFQGLQRLIIIHFIRKWTIHIYWWPRFERKRFSLATWVHWNALWELTPFYISWLSGTQHLVTCYSGCKKHMRPKTDKFQLAWVYMGRLAWLYICQCYIIEHRQAPGGREKHLRCLDREFRSFLLSTRNSVTVYKDWFNGGIWSMMN